MLFSLLLFILLILFLMFPKLLSQYAASGLLLWFERVIPVLFPFMVITSLILLSDSATKLERLLKKNCSKAVCIILGIFAGFPSGALTVAHMKKQGKINDADALRLFCICNCASPGFITGYVCQNILNMPDKAILILLIIHGCTFVADTLLHNVSVYIKRLPIKKNRHMHSCTAITSSISDMSFSEHLSQSTSDCLSQNTADQNTSAGTDTATLSIPEIICSALMSACTAITMAGACIIMCSVLYGFITLCALRPSLKLTLAGMLEITTGCNLCGELLQDSSLRIAAVCAVTVFGGLCSMMQSISVMPEEMSFPAKRYIIVKAFAALICFFILTHINLF